MLRNFWAVALQLFVPQMDNSLGTSYMGRYDCS